LSHQIGSRGSPPFDAITTSRSPSSKKTSGTVRRRPLFLPVVVSSRTGSPTTFPPIRPDVSRYSAVWPAMNARIASCWTQGIGDLRGSVRAG